MRFLHKICLHINGDHIRCDGKSSQNKYGSDEYQFFMQTDPSLPLLQVSCSERSSCHVQKTCKYHYHMVRPGRRWLMRMGGFRRIMCNRNANEDGKYKKWYDQSREHRFRQIEFLPLDFKSDNRCFPSFEKYSCVEAGFCLDAYPITFWIYLGIAWLYHQPSNPPSC
jgi:hypothetical protein